MSIWKKIIIGVLVVVCLTIIAGSYFLNSSQNPLFVALTKPFLTPTPSPLLASTPTDRIVWHDMSDIKFTGLDLNKLNRSLVESWLASSSGLANYPSASDSATQIIFVGKYKEYTNSSIIYNEGEIERHMSFPSDSTARLWKKTPQKLFVASPSLDQIVKYKLVDSGLKPDDLILGLSVRNVNVGNQQGIWIVVFSQN